MAKKNNGYQPRSKAIVGATNQAAAKKFGVNVWAAFVEACTAELSDLGVLPKKPRENALMLVALFVGVKYGMHMKDSKAVDDSVEIEKDEPVRNGS